MNPLPIGLNYRFSTRKISLEKSIIVLFLASAVIGGVLSFSKIYLFHVTLLIIVSLTFLGVVKLRKSSLVATQYLLFLFIYICLSSLWSILFSNALLYIFYLFCGISISFVIVNYSCDIKNLNFVFKILAFFYILNICIGLLETTGLFRLPSPYTIEQLGSTRPSGFDSNINNFGFVFLSIFPFIYLYPRKWSRLIGNILLIWFTIKLESKGFFISALLFYVLLFLSKIEKKNTWYTLFGVILLAIICFIGFKILFSDIQINLRILTTFEQIERGLQIIEQDGGGGDGDSTTIRALMYYYGIKELIASNGLGLGISSISTKIAINTNIWPDVNSNLVSFHNFFLEMMIDLGVLPFLITMFFYFKLIKVNLHIHKNTNCKRLAYYSQSCALSLLLILPASVAPSSIIYVFAFWIVIGFSISTMKIFRLKSASK